MQSLALCTLVVAASAALGSAQLLYSAAPYAGYGYTAAAAPLGLRGLGYAGAAALSTVSQSHQQDELGQYQFGYTSANSARNEVKTADGVVRGSYSYVDSYGIPQKVDYVADALGFRTAATNLPVAPLK